MDWPTPKKLCNIKRVPANLRLCKEKVLVYVDLGSLQQDWLCGGNQSLKGFPAGILMVCRVSILHAAHCSRHMYKNAASNKTYMQKDLPKPHITGTNNHWKQCDHNPKSSPLPTSQPSTAKAWGTEIETDIFVGVVYYQRLRHLVMDKAQVRSRGSLTSRCATGVAKGWWKRGAIQLLFDAPALKVTLWAIGDAI